MAGVDIGKTSGEMIRNGTWAFKDGTFYQALRLESGRVGIVAYDGDFHFPEDWNRAERGS